MTTRVSIENRGDKTVRVIRRDKAGLPDTAIGLVKPKQKIETYLWDANRLVIEEDTSHGSS